MLVDVRNKFRNVFPLLTVLLLIAVSVVQPQKCTDSNGVFVCTDIVDKFPDIQNATSITCLDCKLPVIDQTTVPDFTGTELNVSRSRVKTIRKDAFANFPASTARLIFDHNEIAQLDSDQFRKFPNLTLLDLSHNELTMLNAYQFQDIELDNLNLTKNRINKLDKAFQSVTFTLLDLSYNRIRDVPMDAFDNVKFRMGPDYQSSKLDLSFNQIRDIAPGTFQRIKELTELVIKNNLLETVKNYTFANLTLQTIDLSYNRIATLEAAAFSGVSDLLMLTLSYNRIAKLPLGVFGGLRSLSTLSLDNNKLDKLGTVVFSGLVHLSTLNLSGNSLETFPPNSLIALADLFELDLSYNRLQTLNLKSLTEHNPKIYRLMVNHNFWQCSELVLLYRALNKKYSNIDTQGSDFHVPNLHGIPCSRKAVTVTPDLTFDQFMQMISEDGAFEDIYNVQLESEDDVGVQTAYIKGMYYMMFLFTILFVLVLVSAVFKRVCLFLHKRSVLPARFTIFYNNETA